MDRIIYCLTVTTKDREPFWPWLEWNFNKQTYPHRLHIVVSDGPRMSQDAIWVQMDGSIPNKRNAALRAIVSDLGLVTWMDDDDWQHPDKCQIIADNVRPGKMIGSRRSAFIDLFTKKSHPWYADGPLFNSVGFHARDAIGFDIRKIIASDTPWTFQMWKRLETIVVDYPLHYWLSHRTNISNRADKIEADQPIDFFDEETWLHLRKLEQRLKRG